MTWLVALLLLKVFVHVQSTYIDTQIRTQSYLRNVTCTHSVSFPSACQTHSCARYVADGVFGDDDVVTLLKIVNKGLSHREDIGGPSILDINTGYVRDSNGLENLFALDKVVYSPEDFSHYGNIIKKLKNLVMSTFGISTLFFTAPTFITRLDGRSSWEPKGIHDEYWHVHADMNNTAHYQYSGLLYLSTYNKDFTGGRIHFVSKDDNSVVEDTIEPIMGRTLIFTSDAENPHYVERLLSGERYVLAFWFTCHEKREFEIFLDGEAHSVFSNQVKTRVNKQKKDALAENVQTKESSEQVTRKKKHRRKATHNNDL